MNRPIPEELLVLRLRAGDTEIAIVPSDLKTLRFGDQITRVQMQEAYKTDAINIIAGSLDNAETRYALSLRGMKLVVVR